MIWPGETLLIKLWETLAEKGIGSLLKPWQTRREGQANIDVRRYEMLALADAERQSEEIRSGRRILDNSKFVLSLAAIAPETKTQHSGEIIPLLDVASSSAVADAMRKEINVAKAVMHAEEKLLDDHSKSSENIIDDDWLYRWREYAGSVSTEDLQKLWGQIIAGEFLSPGRYSYRLMDFVKNLTKDEAGLIEKVAPFVVSQAVVKVNEAVLQESGVTPNVLHELQDLGVLSGVDFIGHHVVYPSSDGTHFIKLLTCHGRGLIVEHVDPRKILRLHVSNVTRLGCQVLSLGKFTCNESYLLAVSKIIKNEGFKVSIVDYTEVGDGTAIPFNHVVV
jgi:hypothetical protein